MIDETIQEMLKIIKEASAMDASLDSLRGLEQLTLAVDDERIRIRTSNNEGRR